MKQPSKKARSDAGIKGKQLTDSQKAEVAAWLIDENLGYKEARERIAERFGVFVKSDSTVSEFYHSFALPWKYARSKGVADEFEKLAEGKFEEAALKRMKQLFFETASAPGADLKSLKTFAKILGDSHKLTLAQSRLELDKRKVKLLEAKASLADQATAIANDKQLSEEEQGARMRALFRM
ncbi:MAG: hypothetical protein KF715_08580 [Candidatus Didemnitutus sp.]|nr:hypothetical protein [Candidatus Didemnitutus sp.]